VEEVSSFCAELHLLVMHIRHSLTVFPGFTWDLEQDVQRILQSFVWFIKV